MPAASRLPPDRLAAHNAAAVAGTTVEVLTDTQADLAGSAAAQMTTAAQKAARTATEAALVPGLADAAVTPAYLDKLVSVYVVTLRSGPMQALVLFSPSSSSFSTAAAAKATAPARFNKYGNWRLSTWGTHAKMSPPPVLSPSPSFPLSFSSVPRSYFSFPFFKKIPVRARHLACPERGRFSGPKVVLESCHPPPLLSYFRQTIP